MSKNIAALILVSATFLTPFKHAYADEQSGKACSLLTEVNDAGEIIWSSDDDTAELVADAQSLEISAADYQALCAGEEIVQEAASGDATEEEQESTEVASEDAEEDSGSSLGYLAALAGIGLAGGGGGGGGSSTISDGTYRNTVSGDYGTEYTAQGGLASVNALGLNDYGYTGVGIKVGVVDSGIDKTHAEFDGKTIYGQDFASSGTGYGFDENGHGSHVASIIAGERDGSGMRGVAYEATLFDYKTDNDGDSGLEAISSDSGIASIFNQHVTDDINVSNNSWGLGSSITSQSEAALRASLPSTITALRAAQNNGTLFVFAAGNDTRSEVDYAGGLPYRVTELANEWLVVGAVSTAGVEASFNNRCGVAKAFCVVAPGVSIYAAQANGTYTSMSGTSMAAPHVAGVGAALMEKFPSLTAAQIATRILTTASYASLTGRGGETTSNSTDAEMEAIFGQGMVNSTAAAARIGNYVYANGSNLSNGENVSANRIALPTSLPASTQNQILDSNFIVFDSFDGARFSVDGSQVFSKSSASSIAPLFSSTTSIDTHNDPSFGFISADGRARPSLWMPRFIASGKSNQMTATEGFWGETASLFPPISMLQAEPSTSYIWNQTYNGLSVQPFIQLRDEYDSAKSISGYGTSFNVEFNNGFKLAAGYKFTNNLMKNGILEDAASDGYLSVAELGFVQKTSNTNDIFFRVTNTRIDDVSASNKTFGFRNAKSDSWTLGYNTHGKFGNFAWGVSKANQLSQGSVSLVTPTGRTKTGDVLYTEQHFTVHDDDRLERFFAYKYDFDDGSLSVGLVEDKYDYGNIGAAKLNFSMQF